MYIKICGKRFDPNDINSIKITDSLVLIDAKDDYYRLRYTTEDEISDARNWIQFNNLNKQDLLDAVGLIILTCTYFVNTKQQCEICPLKRKKGCVFTTTPVNWR